MAKRTTTKPKTENADTPQAESATGAVRPRGQGYRLQKFEMYNWGTFDGEVHSFAPRGESTLLVGENGAGKSTIVDGMLTLLVRPGIRNYNVAAGAQRKERSEASYIRGTYDRVAGQDERPKELSLRDGGHFYTALLATFASKQSGRVFTICQVMFLTNREKQIYYAFDQAERGIATDLTGLTSGSEIKSQLKDRGFQVTDKYPQYFGWIQRLAHFRPKAMDVFNQTVAVKDVHRLDEFIREHMLEKKSWNDKVSGLLKHFTELSEAHRALIKVRQQHDMLQPILRHGHRYRTQSALRDDLQQQQEACQLYYQVETVKMLQPLCEQWRFEIEQQKQQVQVIADQLAVLRRNEAQIVYDMEHAGGSRLQELPHLIDKEQRAATDKRIRRLDLERKLASVGIPSTLTSSEQLAVVHEQIARRMEELLAANQRDETAVAGWQYEVGKRLQDLQIDRAEWESLRQRRGNLPQSFIQLRGQLCEGLRLAATDLPFVAELIAVPPEHQKWEASVEQVLHAFARTMLVPYDLYAKVSGFIDQHRLQDANGRGQRLTYDRVTDQPAEAGALPDQLALPQMLQYRADHPLVPYVRCEIARRFDHVACETVEAFQQSTGRAMTLHRHVKQNQRQHAKDDRSQPHDRRHFVLGWDNKAKRQALGESIKQQEQAVAELESRLAQRQAAIHQTTRALGLLEQCQAVTDFDAIDDHRHDFEASQLRLEKQRLEESNDRIQSLQKRLADIRDEIKGYQTDYEQAIEKRTRASEQLKSGQLVFDKAFKVVSAAQESGVLAAAEAAFAAIQSRQGPRVLDLQTMGTLPNDVLQEITVELRRVMSDLDPTTVQLNKAMAALLGAFPDLQSDLDVSPESFVGFEQLAARIAKDDLPRHERRFKQRLKDKVLQEIGLLHGSLENERQEIRDKIDLLNGSLKMLEWEPGSHMCLEPSDTSDQEIRKFRRDLAACLEGTLEGTVETNEETFLRIETLVSRLRDDANVRWREKVIDVRNWFTFAAREFDNVSGEAGSFYDGGAGQSGGEKGKLAFLVLVAAIAYQYDLRPEEPDAERFHFVMVDEMFSRSDDIRAKFALDLFAKFDLQLAIVAPLDAKARVTEEYVGLYSLIVKDSDTHRSRLLNLTAQQYRDAKAKNG